MRALVRTSGTATAAPGAAAHTVRGLTPSSRDRRSARLAPLAQLLGVGGMELVDALTGALIDERIGKPTDRGLIPSRTSRDR